MSDITEMWPKDQKTAGKKSADTPYEQSDAYWLRLYAGQILNAMVAGFHPITKKGGGKCETSGEYVEQAMNYARTLLAAVKEGEK